MIKVRIPFLLSMCLLTLVARPVDPAQPRLQDFDQAVAFVRRQYAWPERIELDALVRTFRPRIAQAVSPEAFQRVLEGFLDGLGDAHSHLGSNRLDSWCLPPGQVAAEWRNGRAIVAAVWRGSDAERAGVQSGMEILEWNGKPLAEALQERAPRLPAHLHEDQARWRLNALLAGRHNAGCRLTLREGATQRDLEIPADAPADQSLPEPHLLAGQIGIIAFQELGSKTQIERIDAALARFPEARAWVLDLRGLRVGGDTAVTVPIMGRFVDRPMIYAWMRRRNRKGLGKAWPEWVKPRGEVFRGPLVILVDAWTASAAEGLAMGLSGMGRGTAVGTRMAGLGAAVHSINLSHSGLRVQISSEPVFDLRHRPRTAFQPDIVVDLAASGDPILEAGLQEASRGLAESSQGMDR